MVARVAEKQAAEGDEGLVRQVAAAVEIVAPLRVRDNAEGVSSETPPGLGASTHSYNVTARTHTVTTPDGSTVIETKGIDGQLASKTGTGIVAQFFTYGVESDGRRWTSVNPGTATSPRWQKSWSDWLGRVVRLERPSFASQPAQGNYVETKTYDTAGRLVRSSSTGMSDTLYVYDALGRLTRSGLAVGGGSSLNVGAADRVTESDQYLERIGSDWWVHSEVRQYATADSGVATVMSMKRERLTGFPSLGGGQVRLSEVQETDVNGNVTTAVTDVTRAAATTVITTSTTGVAIPQVDTRVNGITVTLRGSDGLTRATVYDSLRRKWKALDSRVTNGVKNTANIAYLPGTTLVSTITDATGTLVARNLYDTSGRVVTQATANDASSSSLPHYTRTAYTPRGQVYRQWGDGTNPVEYGYDSTYGDRTSMTTFRGGSGWDTRNGAGSNAENPWPTDTGTADLTSWAYDASSGLLRSKTDAVGRTVSYSYNPRGQMKARTWARGVTTTYSYDLTTAEQRDIVYSDGTPELHYTYNRLGQLVTARDVTGLHTLTHCICGKLVSERFDANFYGNRLLTYSLNQGSSMPKGRTTGFTLANGAGATEIGVSYGYDGADRFGSVTNTTAGIAAASHTFTYGYLADSNLLASLTVDSGSTFTVSRTYESQRDVLTSIDSRWAGTSRARTVTS